MFKNYFKTAWRNLLKNKFYSVINISGLAIGLAIGIMVLMWVQDEYSLMAFTGMQAIFIKSTHILVRAQVHRFGKDRLHHWLFFADNSRRY